MAAQLRDRRELQHDLQSAVANDELRLDFQPLARIDGEIVGFEALVRWHHPSRGLVAPGIFIPLTEENGLIVAMGEWILRAACREAASWPNQLQISVNLSPVQFRNDDIVRLVHETLIETGLDAGRLELEITEGVLIDDFSRAMSILRRLKSLGVRIALDDFGTGYSSMSYLQAFPFDMIKIDRSFISNLERSAQSKALLRGVIGLARGLELPVTAEGVETRAQLDVLTRAGCDLVQGFLIGRPASIDRLCRGRGPADGRARVCRHQPGVGSAGREMNVVRGEPEIPTRRWNDAPEIDPDRNRALPRRPCGDRRGTDGHTGEDQEHRDRSRSDIANLRSLSRITTKTRRSSASRWTSATSLPTP